MPFDAGSPWEEQALTRNPPTTASEGQSLKKLDALTVAVEAAQGQTLTGGGALRCYVFDGALDRGAGGWARLPALDLPLDGTGGHPSAANLRRYVFEPFDVSGARAMRLLFAADGVTVSGGTTVTVYQLGHDRELEAFYKEGGGSPQGA